MKSISQILIDKKANADKVSKITGSKNPLSLIRTHNKYEFQAYGNRLAEEFMDTKHRSLYIKLAKETPRELLEIAREFVFRSEKAETKGKLFMWKLGQLKKERIEKDKLKNANK